MHRRKHTGHGSNGTERHGNRDNIKWETSMSQGQRYMGLEDKDTGVREQWFGTWAAAQSSGIRAMVQGIDHRS